VVKTGKVTQQQREIAWNELQNAAAQGKTRPFYREVNKLGLMYSGIVLKTLINTIDKIVMPFLSDPNKIIIL
jgi:hypothetical protein